VCAGEPNPGQLESFSKCEVEGITVWYTSNIIPENDNSPIVISATKSLFVFYTLEISGARQYVKTIM
jgi:hypothetical protein